MLKIIISKPDSCFRLIYRYAASLVSSTGSTIEGSSFSGLLTRVEIGHIRIRLAGNARIKSRGSGSSLNERAQSPGASHWHAIMDVGHHLVGIGGDHGKRPDPIA
jgi:hypothetical protein